MLLIEGGTMEIDITKIPQERFLDQARVWNRLEDQLELFLDHCLLNFNSQFILNPTDLLRENPDYHREYLKLKKIEIELVDYLETVAVNIKSLTSISEQKAVDIRTIF